MLSRPPGAPSGDLFQALVENSSDAIALLDGDGLIRFASRPSTRILGYSLEERLGRSAFELIHPDDVAAARAAFADCLSRPGVTISADARIRHKDGAWRQIELIAVNRLDETAVGAVVVNYRDVTEQRRAEQALRSSEEQLRRLVEQAQDIIYYTDPRGHFTYVNPTACRVLRYEERELVGRHFLTLIRRDYRHRAAAFYAAQLSDRTPSTYFEFPAVARNGETVWVGQHVQLLFDGDAVSGVQAIARNITRQKDEEEALRKSEARYRALIQGAAYGIYRTTLEGQILDANPAFAAILGYESVDEIAKHNMRDFYLVPNDREQIVARYLKSDRRGRAATIDVDWKRRDGTPINVRLTARVVAFVDHGSCFEGIAEDITAKRVMEEQLRQAQKMEAVGRLARGIAHDFNNVLAAILGCADLLALRLDPGDPSYTEAIEIQKAAERGATLTRQLLAFSRRRALEPQILDLHAIAHGVDSMLARLAEHVELRLHTPGDPPMVHAERGQIEQVLFNLVVNARDAMPEGGAVDVVIEAIELDARAQEDLSMPPGRYARISVRDTGMGIAPELQRHVFEPFFSTKDPEKGTGLGLSIVYGIAKEAGGTVTFSTRSAGPNRGTTFEVLLPLAD